jgi:TonB-dependent receptor
MKSVNRILVTVRHLLVAAFVMGVVAGLAGQNPATGTLEGRVFDAGRGEYVEKARLTIEGTALETLTDDTGQYRFVAVPAGLVRVKVFFTGQAPRTEAVTVVAGQIAQLDLTLAGIQAVRQKAADDIIVLDQFVVASSKEMDGAAIAINEQRFARNVMNVVSADEFGTIADGSIGEFMKFLPGITSDYTGGDARRFSIGGASADHTPISLGGFDMASAAGAGTRRAVELDQMSINNVARIEINKSNTPESPGTALNGSVNFVPRGAFERGRPIVNYSVAWLMKDAERALGRRTPGPGWGQKTYKIHPGVDVSAIVPVTKNFGFTVSAGYSLQYTPQSNTAMQWIGAGTASNATATATTGRPATTPDNPYLAIFSWRDSGKDTDRQNFATTVDWRPFGSRYDRLSLGFSYGALREHFATRTQTYTINRVLPGNWTPEHTWGSLSTFPETGSTINAGQFTIANNGRLRPGRTFAPSLKWLHDGPIWKADAGVAYGSSRIHYQDIDKGFFNGMTIQRNNVQILFDDIFYLRPGRITVKDHLGQPVDPSQLGNYSLVSANSVRQRTYDTTRQAYANVRRDFVVRGIPVSVKLGADIRTRARDLRGVGTETYTWVGADGRASTTPFTQAGLPNDDSPLPFLDVPYSQRIPDFGLPKQQHVDNNKLWADYAAHPEHWTRNANTEYTSVTNASKRMQEIISALFFRNDIALFGNRLKIVSGVRAEQTNIVGEGPLTDPTLAFRRDAGGNVVFQRDAAGNLILNAAGQKQPVLIVPTTAGLPYTQLTLINRGYQAKKEYLRLFPSVNVLYNFTENTSGRLAYFESVGRPDFNQYAGGLTLPNVEVFNPNDRITVSNVGVKAWQSRTYMVRFEHYFGGAATGQLSGGYFLRDYQNFFGTVTTPVTPEFLQSYGLDEETYGVYPVVTQFNRPGTVRMVGFDLDYSQQLTFLPRWAQGLRAFVNVSSQRAKDTDSFQSMNPFTINYGLSLSRRKWNLRINENYRGIQRRAAITGASLEPGTYNYAPKRLYIDVSGEYNFRRGFGLFFAMRNVGGATEDTKIYGPHTPRYARFRQRDDYGGSLWTAGMKGSF